MYSSTISSSAMMQGCFLSSLGTLLFCGVSFPSATGVCSRGGTAPGLMTRSDTRHLFCLMGGVSSTASPCMGTSTTAVGLGVRDQSCTSSVSHSMFLSKYTAMGLSGWAFICSYSTVGSPRGDWVAFGPDGAVDGLG